MAALSAAARRASRLALVAVVGPFAVGAIGACHDNVAPGEAVADNETQVAARCAPDQCDILGACWDDGAANPSNACEACVVLVDRERFSADDDATCDDGDACTSGDACVDGLCRGAALSCDDGDPCTADACSEGVCGHAPDVAACGGDPCAPGQPQKLDCDDHDPCTVDRCVSELGCVHDAVPDDPVTACDDEDACTTGDRCVDGACEGAAPLDCDDHDLCTIDICRADAVGRSDAAAGCVHTSIASLCADANPCTDERCEPATGCVYPFNTAPCDDGNACTAGDTCVGGACLGAAVPFDDLNPCTDDACDALLGPVHVDNRLPCDDGDACTVGDACAEGACRAGATPLDCDDRNQCTDDSCDHVAGCLNLDHTRACDDGDACTSGDACAGGACLGQPVQCDDHNDCTADSCNPATGCVNELLVSNACRPTIVVDYPPRGATLSAGGFGFVLVTGSVRSGAGPITSFTMNGQPVAVAADGTFAQAFVPTFGGNILSFDAADSFGSTRHRVQSFLWSSGYLNPTTPKAGIVPQGVGVWLDTLAIDDGDRGSPPNDLASILQVALRAFDVGALIPRPAAHNQSAGAEDYDIYVNNLRYDPPNASLRAQSGGIHLTGVITNGYADLDAVRTTCNIGAWGVCATPYPSDISGHVTFSSIVIDVDLDLSVAANDVVVTVRDSNVAINGVDISVDGTFGFIADFIIGFFQDQLVSSIASSFNSQLRPVLGSLVRDGLRKLAFNIALNLPKPSGGQIPISLVTDWSSIGCSPEGCAIALRGGAYATTAVTPYANAGVPNRANCGSGAQTLIIPEQSVLELSLADDTLNQLLFAAWRGGILEFPVPPEWLGNVDLAQYGIGDLSMTITGMLAPTASDCGRSDLGAHVGDVRVRAHLTLFGTPLDVDIWASLVAGVTLSVEGGQIALRIDGIERVDTEVEVLDDRLIGLESVIADLIRTQILGTLIGQLSGSTLGSIPLPDIDLSGAIAGLPPGTAIKIVPEVLFRQGGNTIVGGRLD